MDWSDADWNIYYLVVPIKEKSIKLYEKWMREKLAYPVCGKGWIELLKGLSGKRLVCHCKPLACHGDVLIKLFYELINGRM